MQSYAMLQDCGAPALHEMPIVATAAVDKYSLLANLQVMARELGLKPAPLSVLSALCSFYPGRLIDEDVVIFASNAALSTRLHGMPESTLRRHLAALCASGLIARRDSANRKRYARRVGDQHIAFGFSLAPLVQAAEFILERAAELRMDEQRLRLRLADIKARLATVERDDETLQNLKRQTRLTPTPERLDYIEATLEAFTVAHAIETSEADLSASAAQIGRHYKTHIQNITSSCETPSLQTSAQVEATLAKKATAPHFELHYLTQALKICKPTFAFAKTPPTSWSDLIMLAHDLAPSLGLTRSDWQHAVATLGAQQATLLILSLVAKAPEIAHLPSYARAAMATALRNKVNRLH